MWRSWKLGKAFGIDFYVHWSLFLLVGWFAFNAMAQGAGLDGAAYLATLLFAMFGCVALHELGHALTARLFGISTRDITLYPIGGVARLERMSERPAEEFCIAIAGPAVNVVIAAFLVLLLPFVADPFVAADEWHFGTGHFVKDLLAVNVVLVVFNLLPLFPMDGGRVLRAILSSFLGHVRATEWAAAVGAVMAVLLGVAGLVHILSPMATVIAVFIFFAGQAELAMVRQRDRVRRMPVADVIPVDEPPIPQVIPVQPLAFTGVVWDPRERVWVVWRNGRPVHSFSTD